MSQSFNSFRMTPLESLQLRRSRGAAIYTHPDDVASDPRLTLAEKRAVLASWISDARAVENSPSLRRLDSGAVVEVDAILRALVLLDDVAPREDCERLPLSSRRRGVISRLPRRVGPASGANDNDDDPPPAPAGFGIPFRPKPLSPAHGACFDRALEWVCLTFRAQSASGEATFELVAVRGLRDRTSRA
jgi:hypothetical protein